MNKSDYVMVYVEDWSGLFEDGILLMESHGITAHEILMHLATNNKIVNSFTTRDADPDWICELGRYPKMLSDVVFI